MQIAISPARQAISAGWAMNDARNYPAALREFRRAVSLDPNSVKALEGLGHTLIKMKEYDEAEEVGLTLTSLAPDRSEPHMILTQAMRLTDRPKEALAQVEEAVRCAPDDAYVHLMKSWVLNDLERWEESLGSALEARRLVPNDAKIVAHIAELTLVLKGPKAAIPVAREALAINPDNADAQASLCHALILSGDLKAARELAETTLAQNPGDEGAVQVYLLTDPKKFSLLRANVALNYWRRRNPKLARYTTRPWLMGIVMFLAFIAGVGTLGYLAVLVCVVLLHFQHGKHQKGVKSHFALPGLKRGF